MFETLPGDARQMIEWEWPQIEPFYAELAARELNAENVAAWLEDWSQLSRLVSEVGSRLALARSCDTTDQEAERRFFHFLETIGPASETAEQRLKEQLLASGLEPEGLSVPLRNMRAEAGLFREENLPLLVEESKLGTQYDKIVGAQTVVWEGREITLPQLRPVFEDADRARRERAWWLMRERQLADREQLNALWCELLALRQRIAANAGHADYRSYTWQLFQRFDYTPEDCHTFHTAIEQVCVPAATRVYERHRRRMGLETLRPWDLTDGWYSRPAPMPGQVPLQPFEKVGQLAETSTAILKQVDPELGEYFQTMIDEQLLDLDNRSGKAPGGYCTYFAAAKRPFIFMNAVGTHRDVQIMLHEAGHAFHAFEASRLPYQQQLNTPMEFNEVASMSMELLAAPYLSSAKGGFYSDADTARARIEHLEDMLLFWPFMAVVDAFQHWVYTHPDAAASTDNCDAVWQGLWQRYIPAVDWSGLEAEQVSGWQRKLHIFRVPFYYTEYGLAAMGAAQVWRAALSDQPGTVARYRKALALGGTVTLPELYNVAGARFAFDTATMGEVVQLIESTIAELEGNLAATNINE